MRNKLSTVQILYVIIIYVFTSAYKRNLPNDRYLRMNRRTQTKLKWSSVQINHDRLPKRTRRPRKRGRESVQLLVDRQNCLKTEGNQF